MDKKIIYISAGLVLILLVAVGAAFILLSRNTPQQSQSTTAPSVTPTSVATQAENKMSLKDLLLARSAQKCTYKDTQGTSGVEGTSYVSGGKVRSDYTISIGGPKTAGHMIVDGQTSYIWMDSQTTGFKMTLDTDKMAEKTASGTAEQSVDINKTMDFNCTPWTPDAALFLPPTTIKFSDLTKVVPTVTDKCAVCNSLSGDAKTQCLSSLQCN